MKELFLIWLLAAAGQQSAAGIELVASAPKTSFRVGEKIPLTYYIVNRGNQGAFIYPPTPINSFFYEHFGGVSLEILDTQTGQPAQFLRVLSHSSSGESLFPVAERFQKYYRYLAPGALMGRVDEFDTKTAKLKPGSYELRLVFTDNEPERWNEGERLDLGGPVFSGQVKSNALRIAIVEE